MAPQKADQDFDNKTYIEVPETYSRRRLNSLYREIPLADPVSRTLRKYFNAFANLYGIIPLGKVWEIIHTQSPGLVDEKAFAAFVAVARHECEDYCILKNSEIYLDGRDTSWPDWQIIDTMLLYDESDAMREVEVSQQGKEYYVPRKTELLRYSDGTYFEPTPQADELRRFLSQSLGLSPRDADFLFEELLFHVRCFSGDIQGALDIMEQAGATMNEKTFSAFTSIYQEFHNNARMQHNRGFTPHELCAMARPEETAPQSFSFGPNIQKALAEGTMDVKELRQSILTMELPDERLRPLMLQALEDAEAAAKMPKVGRNDLCPCGSGKKYKKCCGR